MSLENKEAWILFCFTLFPCAECAGIEARGSAQSTSSITVSAPFLHEHYKTLTTVDDDENFL
ncbi:uncharacterized protein PHALS_10723 [Plasmopara halstedii]|uniref:RxLR-like protein n=1 Tax=Plasmopara halstedii TaxID=4781 RepID=A0A0P1AII9_PLAHL|nr:uncharacterized protein PHALS_10723 [Plasmopara halstedii]CEG40529.1 hypothetical protein PHALS_10723 [Plasmopara halstedii]|eukprot:XP_024576898.1 hypothetical protein PHALS_10723 [Plasmopara halstedii]